ncbi:hypothetical protein DPMN_157875 [Dreissena polymorpha]|uniref:Uncharacterized protein n=1 Tax=Dreissena polymorpha TaxID=45954 RepID=A0A9D4IMN9_DREPO|nr:hypothetical protein DPMN_157875 [Dreissena polymorpha]
MLSVNRIIDCLLQLVVDLVALADRDRRVGRVPRGISTCIKELNSIYHERNFALRFFAVFLAASYVVGTPGFGGGGSIYFGGGGGGYGMGMDYEMDGMGSGMMGMMGGFGYDDGMSSGMGYGMSYGMTGMDGGMGYGMGSGMGFGLGGEIGGMGFGGKNKCKCRKRCYPWERYAGKCWWCLLPRASREYNGKAIKVKEYKLREISFSKDFKIGMEGYGHKMVIDALDKDEFESIRLFSRVRQLSVFCRCVTLV